MFTRRKFMAATLGGAALLSLPPFAIFAGPASIGVEEAHDKASSGDLLLLDIRSPAEWKRTGVGASAHPVSMHEPGFMKKVEKLTGSDTSKPVAVMCATGGRSSRMQQHLTKAGYTNVVDVSEGMLGGANGPGWLRSGLPVEPYRTE